MWLLLGSQLALRCIFYLQYFQGTNLETREQKIARIPFFFISDYLRFDSDLILVTAILIVISVVIWKQLSQIMKNHGFLQFAFLFFNLIIFLYEIILFLIQSLIKMNLGPMNKMS